MKFVSAKLCVFLFAITFLLAQCKKGDTGPAGAAGANGSNGPAGPAGPQGPKGDSGTANVIYSQWLDVAFDADTIHNGAVIDTIGFFADIAAAKLDSLMLANGEIKVYLNLRTTANPAVVPLPYIDVFTNVSITPTFVLHDIFLYSNADASTVTQGGQTYLRYRYILIPGGTGGVYKSNDWNDYNQVKAILGLKD